MFLIVIALVAWLLAGLFLLLLSVAGGLSGYAKRDEAFERYRKEVEFK